MMYFEVKRLDLKWSCHREKRELWDMMEILTNASVVIIMQCLNGSNSPVVHFKLMQCYMSMINQKKKKSKKSQNETKKTPSNTELACMPHLPDLPPSPAEKVSQRKQIPVLVFEGRTKWSWAGRQEVNGKSTGHRLCKGTLHTLWISSSK